MTSHSPQHARSILQTLAGLAAKYRGFVALCDQGVISVTNFLTAMVIGRACGKAELGVYTLAWSILSLANGISATLITSPCTILGPHFTRARRRRFLGSLAAHQSILSLALAIAMSSVAALSTWAGWLPGGVSRAIYAIALVIVFTSLRDFVRTVSFAELRTEWALSIDLIASALQLAGISLLLHFRLLDASRTFAVLGIAAMSASAIWLAFNRGTVRLNPRLVLPDLTGTWTFAKWLLGSAVAWQVATYFYPWMLAAFHGTSATGDWAACGAIVAAANPIFLGLNNYVSPKIANVYATDGVTHMRRYVHRCSLNFAALLLPFVLTMAVAGRYLVTRLYGASYNGATVVILLLALNMWVNSITNPFAQGLFNLKRARVDMNVNILSVALLFTIGLPIVRSYGATGAAAALLASSALVACIKIVIFRRESGRQRSAGASVAPPLAAPGLAT